jgi:protein gp37
MGETTGIAWTKSTWNPWQGCLKISPGCKLCYMYRDKERYGQDPRTVVRSKPPTFNKPLSWKEPGLVFTCSWSDWFIEQADAWRDEAWDIVRRTPHLTYQILTKRPENIAARLPKDWGRGYPNVWLGVSVEEQRYADERIPLLLETRAAIRFLSVEPQLGPVDLDLRQLALGCGPRPIKTTGIDWVIQGGESGPKARPFDLAWARDLRDQCKAAGVAYFFKQAGANVFNEGVGLLDDDDPGAIDVVRVKLKDRAGADPSEWPADLRVQEFPKARAD